MSTLADLYDAHLTKTERESLVTEMKKAEIETEYEHLKPNIELINAIRRLKKNHPYIKVYFLSDMYLRKNEIRELLEHFKIDIFNNGIVSTDVQAAKFNGSLYRALSNSPELLGGNFSIFHNLHIGDSAASDVAMARACGSYAMLYHPYRFRHLRTLLGRLQLHKINKSLAKQLTNTLIDKTEINDGTSTQDAWHNYGLLFSQPLYSFLCHVGIAAKNSPDTKFVMVSSEATLFKDLGDQLFPSLFKTQPNNNILVRKKLNRRMALRSLIWEIASSNNLDYDIQPIIHAINSGEVDGSRRQIYDFIFDKGYPYSEFVINNRSDKEFIKGLISDIRLASPKYTERLRQAYAECLTYLPNKNSTDNIVFVDVGWGGTIQLLTTELMRLLGYTNNVSGLYIGCHRATADRMLIGKYNMYGYFLPNLMSKDDRPLWNAALWEYAYTNKIQYPEDRERLQMIRLGMHDGMDIFRQTNLNPKVAFHKVCRPLIKRFVNKPNSSEATIIGSIRFDMGFVDKSYYLLVDTSYSLPQFYKMLLRHPRRTLQRIIFAPNVWSAGYINYYHLSWLKPILRLRASVKHKNQII